MKIGLVSDLHLEFAPAKLSEGADVLLLAGDITPAVILDTRRTDKESSRYRSRVDQFAEEELPKFKEVYHIMGNHEHYHGLWEQTADILREYWARKAPHVKLLDKEFTMLNDGTMLWGATFWTDFMRNSPVIMNHARMGMNDYSLIRTFLPPANQMYNRGGNFRKIQPEMVYEDHMLAMAKLKEDLEAYPYHQWVVMTHHGPSYKSIDRRFGNDPLNFCYASDLDEFILDHPQINAWVHGHTHVSHRYSIERQTTIFCNPRGYTNLRLESENKEFNPGFYFEILDGEEKNNASDEETISSRT